MPVFAQTEVEDEIIKGIVPYDEQNLRNAVDKARLGAREILDSKPKKLEVNLPEQPSFRPKAPEPEPEPAPIVYEEAPFGLGWKAPKEHLEKQGVTLAEIQIKGEQNVYFAKDLPKPLSDFAETALFFGGDDKLWRIVSYGTPIEDTEKADRVLAQYAKYSKMLEAKYGNKKETFTPKIYQKQTEKDLGNNEVELIIELVESTIGNENFLQELHDKETSLFSKYSNNDIDIILSINVNEEGTSQIIIDYKKIDILKQKEDLAFDTI